MSGFVFIHSRIANIEPLIAGLDGDVQVVVLNPTQPGVTKIVTALAGVTNLDFVHHASA